MTSARLRLRRSSAPTSSAGGPRRGSLIHTLRQPRIATSLCSPSSTGRTTPSLHAAGSCATTSRSTTHRSSRWPRQPGLRSTRWTTGLPRPVVRRASSSHRTDGHIRPKRANSSSSGARVEGPTCASSHSFIGAASVPRFAHTRHDGLRLHPSSRLPSTRTYESFAPQQLDARMVSRVPARRGLQRADGGELQSRFAEALGDRSDLSAQRIAVERTDGIDRAGHWPCGSSPSRRSSRSTRTARRTRLPPPTRRMRRCGPCTASCPWRIARPCSGGRRDTARAHRAPREGRASVPARHARRPVCWPASTFSSCRRSVLRRTGSPRAESL